MCDVHVFLHHLPVPGQGSHSLCAAFEVIYSDHVFRIREKVKSPDSVSKNRGHLFDVHLREAVNGTFSVSMCPV